MEMKIVRVLLAAATLLSPATVRAGTAANSPVGLADAQSFEAPLSSNVTPAEISGARRRMASAVAAEKFIDGVKAVAIVALAVYLAWPDGGGSSGSRVFAPQRWYTPMAPVTGGAAQ